MQGVNCYAVLYNSDKKTKQCYQGESLGENGAKACLRWHTLNRAMKWSVRVGLTFLSKEQEYGIFRHVS